MPKISIVTPTVRNDQVEIVKKCLLRQTFKAWEWIIVAPHSIGVLLHPSLRNHEIYRMLSHDPPIMLVNEPEKKDGEYYKLNSAWNTSFRLSEGEIIVSIVDGLWFPPDTLEKLWIHYQSNNKLCVGGIGHQYDRIENGKPEHMVWRDPRARTDYGSFWEIKPIDFELCLASIPKQAIYDVGGVDENFDRYAALSEKEMCIRIDQLGYKFYLDSSIEYRAIKHDRINSEWDKKYQEGWGYFDKCLKEIKEGKRLKLNFV